MKDGHCGGGSARTNRFARPKHLINRQAKEQEAKELDERQFFQRVRACEQKLYNTARMLLPCQADCVDAVQEALFKAWARLDSLRDAERFEAWLMRILINECKMLLRCCGERHANILSTTSLTCRTGEYASPCAKDITMVKWRAPLWKSHLCGRNFVRLVCQPLWTAGGMAHGIPSSAAGRLAGWRAVP